MFKPVQNGSSRQQWLLGHRLYYRSSDNFSACLSETALISLVLETHHSWVGEGLVVEEEKWLQRKTAEGRSTPWIFQATPIGSLHPQCGPLRP